MKWTELYCVVFCLLSASVVWSQDLFDDIQNLNIKNQRDSATALMNFHEDRFETMERWDSLARLYLSRAETVIRSEGYPASVRYFDKAKRLLLKYYNEYHPFYLYYLYSYSSVQMSMGDYSTAEGNIDFLISAAQNGGFSDLYKNGMVNRAIHRLYTGSFPEADSLIHEILPHVEMAPIDTFNLIQAYKIKHYLDSYYHRMKSALAVSKVNLELVLAKYGLDHPNTAMAYDDLATDYSNMGEISLAFDHLFKSRDIFYKEYLKSGNTYFLSESQGSIGLLYKQIGEADLAAKHLLYGMNLYQEFAADDHMNLLWYYNVLTETFIASGDLKKARKYNDLAEGLVFRTSEGSAYQKNFVKGYEAEILHGEGHYEMSLKRAIEIYEYLLRTDTSVTRDQISTLNLICLNYQKLQEPDQALSWGMLHVEKTEEYYGKHHSETLLALTNVMEAHLLSDEPKGLSSVKDTILDRWSMNDDPRSIKNCIPDKNIWFFAETWATYLGQSIQKDADKRKEYFNFLEDFESYYQRYLNIVRSDTRMVQDEASLLKIYRAALHYYSTSNPEKFVLLSEKIKAFRTKMLLQSQMFQDTDAHSPENKIRKMLPANDDFENLESFIEVGRSFEDYVTYKDSLHQHDPVLYMKKYGVNEVSMAKLHQVLSKDEILLEYLKVDSLFYLATYDGKQTRTHQIDYEKVNKLLSKYLKKRTERDAQKLYELLIPPEVTAIPRWLIVPDGILYNLNFEELITKSGEYLIHSKEIRYTYSGSVLYYQKQMASKNSDEGYILSMTPGFSESLRNLQLQRLNSDTLWTHLLRQPFLVQLSEGLGKFKNSLSLVDSSATEYFFKNNNDGYNVIHFGTHGILNNEAPLFSKLLLVSDQGEDGSLYAHEIYGQDLHTNLVVLSACQTGVEQMGSGQGLVSLAHAFAYAGSPSILMTLWEVDEKSTSMIVEKFYKYLMRGERKPEALRKAKLDYLAGTPLEVHDPYYWAGLVLMGNEEAVFSRSAIGGFWLFAVATIIILFVVWGIRKHMNN